MPGQPANRILRIGLTGGIASGKSTVSALFGALGVPIIDTDELAREVVRPGSAGLAQIVAAFGPEVLDAAGGLDRRQLRARVFADAQARRQLEAITHPLIRAAALAACERAGGPYQVLVVPLLIESGFDQHVDRVLVVDCPIGIQRQRLLERDREDPAQAERILRTQLDPAARRARADDIIANDGDLARLREQVQRLHELYLGLAATRPATPPAGG